MFLAEQDWMTNLGFSYPHLFYHLPCQFNRQTTIDYLKPPWVDIFHSYHHCDLPRNIKIFHRNGCGPTPKCCGHDYPSNGSQLHDINMDMEQFWLSVSNINKFERTKLGMFSKLLSEILFLNCVPDAREFCLNVVSGIDPLDSWTYSYLCEYFYILINDSVKSPSKFTEMSLQITLASQKVWKTYSSNNFSSWSVRDDLYHGWIVTRRCLSSSSTAVSYHEDTYTVEMEAGLCFSRDSSSSAWVSSFSTRDKRDFLLNRTYSTQSGILCVLSK